MIHRTFSMLLLCITLSSAVFSQSRRSETTRCEEYIFNTKKLKVKVYTKNPIFNLQEVEVEELDPVYTSFANKKCDEPLPVVFKPEPFETALKKAIEKGFTSEPNGLGISLKIRVRNLAIIENFLPTSNPRLYLAVDFMDKDMNGDYKLAYSATYFFPSGKFLELPMNYLMEFAIKDFTRKKPYLLNLKLNESSDGSVIFTSYKDFLNNNPSYDFTFKFAPDTSDSSIIKYYMLDEKDKIVKANFFAVRHEGRNYLNVDMYYPKGYYSLIEDLNEDYFFLYDQVYDYTKATNTTIATGGGLLGAAIGTASSTRNIPALIEKSTGKLIAFSNKNMREILEDYQVSFGAYNEMMNGENMEGIKQLFNQLLADEKLFN